MHTQVVLLRCKLPLLLLLLLQTTATAALLMFNASYYCCSCLRLSYYLRCALHMA
jgi:hypothetical protein